MVGTSQNSPTRVGVYLRVSSQEQVSGYSLDAQRRAISHYCEAFGIVIAREFCDEGVSAKTDDLEKRPAFRAAVEAVEQGEFDAIIVHKIDRFARSMLLALETLERIAYRLICLDPPLDFSTPTGRMHANIMMAFADYFSDNLGEEVRKGLHERRKQGYWLGPLPFGICHQTSDSGVPPRKLPPVPDRKIVVTDSKGNGWSRYDALCRIFELVADGASIPQVTRAMHELGFRLSHATIHGILCNRIYIGELRVTDKKRRVREWVPAVHEPFIDPQLFQRAEAVRIAHRNGAARVRTKARLYPFRGLAVCGRCQGALHHSMDRHGTIRLHCARRLHEKACDQPSLAQRAPEAQILEVIDSIHLTEDMVQQAVEMIDVGEVRDLDAERRQLERRMHRLKLMYLNTDDLSLQEYEERKYEIERQLKLLQPIERGDDTIEKLTAYLQDFRAAYSAADHAQRNRLLALLFEKVVIDGRDLTHVALTPEADYVVRRMQRAKVNITSGAA